VKKGRHRRFEEARALKRTNDLVLDPFPSPREDTEPCAECDAAPGRPHASWCLVPQEEDEDAAAES
jgi:hypothetical protein